MKFILPLQVRKLLSIISRCQRFDLKRVSVEKLAQHLKNISSNEKGNISENAIKLIARTSEGSVRDAISLLDRALVSKSMEEKKVIEEDDVRNMLGLADRTKVISLLNEALQGNEKNALNYMKELIEDGIDAKILLNDILEVLYLFSRTINLGVIEKDMSLSETEIKLVEKYSKNIDMQDLGLFWQLTLKTIDDLRIIGNENLTLEMYVMQLTHLKKIDFENNLSKENKSQYLNEDNLKSNLIGKKTKSDDLETSLPNQIKNQLRNIDQVKTNPVKDVSNDQKSKSQIKSFQDLIDHADKDKEVELKFDLERNVKLVSFNKGKIDISFNEKLNKNFIKNLTEKLFSWTGERWIISLSKNNEAKSIYEQSIEKKSQIISEFKKGDLAKKMEEEFPDAKLIEVREKKND